MDTQDIAALNSSDYKKYHETLMQNNHGSSAVHVFFCVFFTVQCSIYSSFRITSCTKNRYIYEYLTIVLPLILAHTVLANYIYLLNIIIFILLLSEIPNHLENGKRIVHDHSLHSEKVKSISMLRGLTYLITVCCILAVDFNDFPRHLAKTERFGVSLMDTGVGLFVLMSGLVHKRFQHNKSYVSIFIKNMKLIVVLIILGVMRYVSVKHLDYQQHVTEYGVHWNFFFTLAVCKLVSSILLHYTDKAFGLSIMLLVIHEFILRLGIQEWVFSDAPRDTFISANREGIFSCLGYVSMYIFASELKVTIFCYSIPMKIKVYDVKLRISDAQIFLFIMSYVLLCLAFCVNMYVPASRTLANSAYCLYLDYMLVTILAILYTIETMLHDEKNKFIIPKLVDNINCNGLSFFLIANLLTGAINLSVKTFTVSSVTTFIILNIYMMVTLGLTMFIRRMGIQF